MDEAQAAHLRICSLKPGYELTLAIIYRTVHPLTLSRVASVLPESDAEAGITSIRAIQACHVSNTGCRGAYPSRRAKFTPTDCLGPHYEADYCIPTLTCCYTREVDQQQRVRKEWSRLATTAAYSTYPRNEDSG